MTIGWLRPTRASVEALRIFLLLDNDATIDGLVRELPQYIAATEDVAIEYEGREVEWWNVYEERLPNWSSAVKKSCLFNLRLLPQKEFLACYRRLSMSMHFLTTCKQL